jgi:hypothetical protein
LLLCSSPRPYARSRVPRLVSRVVGIVGGGFTAYCLPEGFAQIGVWCLC